MISINGFQKSWEALLLFTFMGLFIMLQSCENNKSKTETETKEDTVETVTKTEKPIGGVMEPNAGEHL